MACTRTLRRLTGASLLVVGAIVVFWCLVQVGSTLVYQWRQQEIIAGSDAFRADSALAASRPLNLGEPIGVLEIPRLRVKGVVAHGDDAAVLARAIGHLPDTPPPWRSGNSALAAHRDMWFRPLRHVGRGDRLRLTTPHGSFDYRVRDTFIVDPDAVWVLAPTAAPTLTLITCFPFDFIGPAPKRFIVRADRLAPEVDAATRRGEDRGA